MKHLRSQAGQLLIELLLALGIASLVLPALLTGIVASREGKPQQTQRLQATALMREASEAMRSVRELAWAGISTNGTYHLDFSGGHWNLVSGSETISGFTRAIVVSSVYRDSANNIVTSGTLDPSTKKVVISVSWTTPHATTVSSSFYMTRYLDNITHVETTDVDFNAGTKSKVLVTNVSGGEVELGGGGASDWCSPNLSTNPTVDLPKNGVANSIYAIEGKIFSGTGDNASGVSYATVTVTNANPPVAAILNTFNGYKTNAAFGDAQYAYLATDNNSKEVVIIDITGATPSEVGSFNAPGVLSGSTVVAGATTGFMTAGSTLYSFDLSSKTGSRTQLGSLAIAGNGKKLFLQGSYLYVVTDSSGTQLQIVDVSNPASMSVVGQASVNGGAGVSVFIKSDGTRAYLVTASSATQSEFFVIDISTKTGSHSSSFSYDTSGMSPTGVTAVSGNKAIIVGTGGEEYQVVRLTASNVEVAPVHCGGLNIDSGIHGLASVLESDNDAFTYIITGDSTSELKIISGDPGDGGGAGGTNGTFESATFDAGYTAAFNRFHTHSTLPGGTTVKYQVAVAPAVSGSCVAAVFSFLGPDNTNGTYFTADTNPIPFGTIGGYQNPGRCFRYKVFLSTTDPNSTPIFSDITINYSP
ncbi:MAG TPA: hypothetical protein VFG51_02045 [Candidatus Saccharimonadia bacterium]|nr:hypothetical protein [Candidatus Saccharimonadia bacterium]